ncbi:RNA-binding protein [Candidatus Woesebacteria bacterium]|nr:RNA-binding protein [Candidatus Woesebacteria bacterium]
MQNKVYVGNLPYRLTIEELKAHFSPAGTIVDAIIIRDRQTNRSKGFGFVEFETDEMAQKAIEMFHQQELDGRTLVVNIARPKANNNERRFERPVQEAQETTDEAQDDNGDTM